MELSVMSQTYGAKPSLILYISYGSLALFLSILNNIFILYHIETFVSIYNIDKRAFWIGETIFLLWNSFNDPLFGWISDHSYLKSSTECSNEVIIKRATILAHNGPFFAIVFMSVWYLLLPPGLQFVLCLCIYDSFLTIIDLQHTALLADLAVSSNVRANFNSFNSLFSCLGSVSVFLSYIFWDRTDLRKFRMFCFTLSVISMLGFKLSSSCIIKFFSKSKMVLYHENYKKKHEKSFPGKAQTLKSYIYQLSYHKNFHWFTAMNLIQVFNCHFNSNFFPLFLEVLLGGTLSPRTASILLGISFLAPHINNLYFMQLCRTFGSYRVVQGLFLVKFLLTLLMWCLGQNHVIFMCFFVASNRIFTEGTCKLLNLVLSDLVDEDMVLNDRPQAISALIFGTSSLLSKPGQTFAPLLGTWLLSWYTGEELFSSAPASGSIRLGVGQETILSTPVYREACFWLLVQIPLVCSFLQLVIWTQFSLHGKKLERIKYIRTARKPDHGEQCI